MKPKSITAFTVFGLMFITLGLSLFGDDKILQYSFMGAGILMIVYSALKGGRPPVDKPD